MSDYYELKKQAEELLKQADALRERERMSVLQAVRSEITEWQFTVVELGLKPSRADKRSRLPIKYRDPDSGKEWCGRGAMPKWLAQHLSRGHTREQFLIA